MRSAGPRAVPKSGDLYWLNIYRAGLLAMRRAVCGLNPQPDFALVDARKIPGCPCPLKRHHSWRRPICEHCRRLPYCQNDAGRLHDRAGSHISRLWLRCSQGLSDARAFARAEKTRPRAYSQEKLCPSPRGFGIAAGPKQAVLMQSLRGRISAVLRKSLETRTQ